jgi:subtilisin family serine protease
MGARYRCRRRNQGATPTGTNVTLLGCTESGSITCVENPRPPAAPVVAAVVAILLALLTAVPGGPLGTEAAFAAAPDGRLVVTWRDDAPARLDLDGVAEIRRSRANEHRAVVVARPGAAGAVAARLKADPAVESVVPDALGSAVEWPLGAGGPDDPLYGAYQKDLPLIGLPSAWALTTGSPSVVVAVLDTGYEGTHEDLAAVPTVSPYNARTGSRNVTDGYGHGTHVAGTIAAGTNNAIGVAGIAPGVAIMPVKVLDASGQGYWSDFLEGVDWARTHGASVVNLSLGSGLSAAQIAAFQPTFTAAWDAGVLVIAAAGNNNNSTPFYPASFAKVISVSATTNADVRAPFSNYGPKVDLSAPGAYIASTFKDGTYRTMSGTSMATPHVAGLAGLIRSLHPTYTPADVEAVMKQTALDLGAAGRDDYFGHGRIRTREALALDITLPTATVAAPTALTNVPESITPTVAFSEPVVGVDATTVMLLDGAGTAVPATVTYDTLTDRATVTPTALLASRSAYRVEVSGAIRDASGNPLAPISAAFTTGDTILPTVTSVHPASGRTDVARGVTIRLAFSEKVRGVSGLTLKLRDMKTGNRVLVTVHYDKATRTATIDPATRLAAARWYRVKILSGIEDVAGLDLSPRSSTFRTRA